MEDEKETRKKRLNKEVERKKDGAKGGKKKKKRKGGVDRGRSRRGGGGSDKAKFHISSVVDIAIKSGEKSSYSFCKSSTQEVVFIRIPLSLTSYGTTLRLSAFDPSESIP